MGVMVLVLSVAAGSRAAEAPSNEELWKMLQGQQKLIEEQRVQIEQLQERLLDAESRVEATGDLVESKIASSEKASEFFEETHIGGYGELHYNNLENRASDGEDKKEIDFHRFVLLVGHDFTERIRFRSEVELEHAVSANDEEGEVELEQAYVEFDLSDHYRATGGLFLVPVGIMNETHEPPTFYGVERNPVETYIIPTTWWEGGAMLSGRWDHGLSAKLALTSGLKTDDFSIRGGRQEVSEADASAYALTGSLAWHGFPGLELGVTAQYQENLAADGIEKTPATLLEAHMVYQHGPFGLRALYARWDLDSDAADAAGGYDEQYGFYVEPSYRFLEKLGVFARYNQWDNAAGSDAMTDNEYQQWNMGVNYWPIPDVVLKFDYQNQDAPTGEDEFDGFNLGIGYQF